MVLTLGFLFPGRNAVAAPDKEIIVSAAISLKKPFEEIGRGFEMRNKGVKVIFNFGGSGGLARQLETGAPVDVFASASPKDMDTIASKGLIVADTRVDFAGNSLVLIKPVRSEVKIEGFNDLLLGKVKRIAIGNPVTVPVGRYAMEVLTYLNLSDEIKDKYVPTENVRQVIDYVARGEVEAGVAYSTDISGMEDDVRAVVIAPEGSHKPVIYPIAVIKGSKYEQLAKEFVRFVISAQGQEILKRYGFRNIK